MTSTYTCAYCGSQQTTDSDGARVCSHCGATQPERGVAGKASAMPKRRLWPVALVCLLLLATPAVWLMTRHRKAAPAPIIDGTQNAAGTATGRLVRVVHPMVRTVPAGSNLTAQQLLLSAPQDAGALFDTRQLISKPFRRVADVVDNKIYYISEVTNVSTSAGASGAAADIVFYKRGQEVHATAIELPDLPPGANMPVFFTWDGDANQFDRLALRWKPTGSYPVNSAHFPQLVTTITEKKMSRSDTIINFQAPIYYTTATVSGTVVNRGQASAAALQIYLILRDAQGRITGFKQKDLATLAPGATTIWQTDADQWDGNVASVQAIALSVTPPTL